MKFQRGFYFYYFWSFYGMLLTIRLLWNDEDPVWKSILFSAIVAVLVTIFRYVYRKKRRAGYSDKNNNATR